MKKYIIALLLMAGVAQATTNEISTSITLKVNKNATQITRNTGTILIQMAGNLVNVQSGQASTTPTNLTKGGVTTPGWVYIRNLSTNAAEKIGFSFDGGTTTNLLLEAEEAGVFRADPGAAITNWTVGTSTGTCNFEFTLIED